MLTTLSNRVSAFLSDPFEAAFREFDRDWNGTRRWTFLEARKVAPLSMWEDDESVYIEMDVPGIALRDLDVSVQNGKLTIRGERKVAAQPSEYMHDERFFGQFERTVALNEWVDPEHIEATLSDGVLHLKLAKKPEAQRHKIAITYCGEADAKRIEASS